MALCRSCDVLISSVISRPKPYCAINYHKDPLGLQLSYSHLHCYTGVLSQDTVLLSL
jgi:hypothetical protein